MTLLRSSNRDLARSGVWTFTLPALHVTLDDGSRFVTCPNAGVCAAPCYARNGTYRFSNVLAAHRKNLEATFNPEQFERDVIAELQHKRFKHDAFVRIHDGGAFYSERYARAWLTIATVMSDVTFYAYTKEVSMFKRLDALTQVPSNFIVIYSFGGKEDHLIDRDHDRNCDVFADIESLIANGYHDQGADDRLAALGPKRVGIVANKIPKARRLAAGRSFSDWQGEHDARASDRALEL